MKVLLTGASGFVGQHLSAALQAAGHTVRPVSRRHGVNMAQMLQPTQWLPYLDGVDAVINAAGIIAQQRGQSFEALHHLVPVALFQACVQAKVHRVVQISALGADASAFSAFHTSKRAADDALRALQLQGVVLRPGLVIGAGGQSACFLMRLAALPVLPVLGDTPQRLQPVHISDLVASVLQCLQSRTPPHTMDVVGPEAMPLQAWLERMRCAQGLAPARVMRVPRWLAMAAAVLGQHLHPLLQPDNLRMLEAGSTADVQPLATLLGRMPIALQPYLLASNATRPTMTKETI